MSELKRIVEIRIPYIGGILSVNRYKYKGGIHTKREVKNWMDALAILTNNEMRKLEICPSTFPTHPIKIHLSGIFKDNRVPDLANLHKVVGDALEMALDINDKHFRFIDGGYLIDKEQLPELIIGIEVE